MECPVCGAYGWMRDETPTMPAVPGAVSARPVIKDTCLRCGYEKPSPIE